MVCAVLARQCARGKKKSPSDYGKSRHHPYLITGAKRTTHAVVFLIQFHHLMSPAHSIPPCTVVPLPSPTETSPPLLVAEGRGESGKPNQGNRYDRCNPRYQISRQLSPTSPWIHRAGTLQGIFAGASRGDAKTYHQSNFPPGPPTKQSVWGNTCIIHLFAETAMGEHRRA